MVRHKRSWSVSLLEAACPSVPPEPLPCGDVLLLRAVSVTLSTLSVTGGFALLVALRPNFFRSNFSQKPCERFGNGSTEEKARIFSCLSLSRLPAWKDMLIILRAYVARGDSLTNDRYAWSVGFWNFFTRRILEIPTDRPRKVCEKLSDFWKAYMFKETCTSVGFLRGRVWFPLWSNVITLARNRVNDRDRDVHEHGRKGKDIFLLDWAASLGRKGHVRRT